MFKTSVVFVKTQLPNVTTDQLLGLYERELRDQSVSNISIGLNTIHFSNDTFKMVFNRYANKFSGFTNGQLKITETETEFIVYLEANMTRLFVNAGLIATIVTLFLLLFTGFDIFPLFTGLVIFAILTAIGFISTSVSFPVYFTSLRNAFERELQSIPQ